MSLMAPATPRVSFRALSPTFSPIRFPERPHLIRIYREVNEGRCVVS